MYLILGNLLILEKLGIYLMVEISDREDLD
jgi:hypothetical protein